MKNLHLATLLLLTFTTVFVTACSKQSRLTRVTVAGESNIKAQPDTAVVVISVVTQGQQALNAQQENARKSDAVIHAVQGAAGSHLPKIIGYDARNTVTVTLGELNSVGAVIDAASRAGANSIESVAFILRENSPARGQTLADATRQAMSKAQSIAQALGGRVLRVVEEQEGGTVNRPADMPMAGSSDAEANSNMSFAAKRALIATPVEAGSLNVKSQVQLVVEIEAQQ
ncbi:MAG: hypothetical protein AUG51_22415 [Acidobacteria bacterium 13_1_20CM_3_53_8]|nr:MAG: hypothetical protein AUG51_22415 [Acidobacteria bacterium 13_1_20CM_3_53_8]